MKPISAITEEDFSFKKNHIRNNKTIFSNKLGHIIFTVFIGFCMFSIYSFHNKTMRDIDVTLNQEANSIQGIHQLKEDSIKLISDLSFNENNINQVAYNLEKNPLMSYQGYESIVKFLSEKKKLHKNIAFLVDTLTIPSLRNISFNANTNEEFATISIPINEVSNDISNKKLINIVYTISLEYKLVNHKYVLNNIYETSPKF